jgi:hypothetical protein
MGVGGCVARWWNDCGLREVSGFEAGGSARLWGLTKLHGFRQFHDCVRAVCM